MVRRRSRTRSAGGARRDLSARRWGARDAQGLEPDAGGSVPAFAAGVTRLPTDDPRADARRHRGGDASWTNTSRECCRARCRPTGPREALKAQAVAARCYAASARRHTDVGADVCTTVHCQVWSPMHYETTDQAVRQHAQRGRHLLRATSSAPSSSPTATGTPTATRRTCGKPSLPYCRSVACPCGFTSMLRARRGHVPGGGARPGRERPATPNPDALLSQHASEPRAAAHPERVPRGHADGRRYGHRCSATRWSTPEPDQPIAAHLYIDGHTYSMSAAGPQLRRRHALPLQHPACRRRAHLRLPFRGRLQSAGEPSRRPARCAGPTRERERQRPPPTPLPTPCGHAGRAVECRAPWRTFATGHAFG